MIVTKAQNTVPIYIATEKALIRYGSYLTKILQLKLFLFAILILIIFVKKIAFKRGNIMHF